MMIEFYSRGGPSPWSVFQHHEIENCFTAMKYEPWSVYPIFEPRRTCIRGRDVSCSDAGEDQANV
jgi:hypothetical protein